MNIFLANSFLTVSIFSIVRLYASLYLASYFFPSDRSTISQKYIEDFSNKLYFNKRLNEDLKRNQPNLIIDLKC